MLTFGTAAVADAAALFIVAAPPAMARDHHRRHEHHHSNIGAGIAGFAAGAIIGGALSPHRYYGPDYYAYEPTPPFSRSVRWCTHYYRSYDLRSRTYLGYDGYRHRCP